MAHVLGVKHLLSRDKTIAKSKSLLFDQKKHIVQSQTGIQKMLN